jgi:hypothetical protein
MPRTSRGTMQSCDVHARLALLFGWKVAEEKPKIRIRRGIEL